MTAWYLDSSALVKLAVDEAESAALRAWFSHHLPSAALVTCELAVAEVVRAVDSAGGDGEAALQHLDLLDLLTVDRTLLLEAARIGSAPLRTLDALHLAAARSLGDDLDGVVTYDGRMGEAAAALGIAVDAPGFPAAP